MIYCMLKFTPCMKCSLAYQSMPKIKTNPIMLSKGIPVLYKHFILAKVGRVPVSGASALKWGVTVPLSLPVRLHLVWLGVLGV